MGLGHCSRCGSLQGVALACRHVVAAASSAAPRFAAEFLRYGDADDADLGLIYPATFCRACIDRLGLPPNGAYAPRGVVDAACGEVDGVCSGCLQRWLDAPMGSEPAAAPDPAA
jgi:hypothetical protein